jgi:hypothetical protein
LMAEIVADRIKAARANNGYARVKSDAISAP